MAKLTSKAIFRPSLLDLFTDDEPLKKAGEPLPCSWSFGQLKESIKRDLLWLLNTVNLTCVQQELTKYSFVAQSVLNFGIPDMVGRSIANLNLLALAKSLKEAIMIFETRLLKESLSVEIIDNEVINHHNMLFLLINADLFTETTPIPLVFRVQIDLESGDIQLDEV